MFDLLCVNICLCDVISNLICFWLGEGCLVCFFVDIIVNNKIYV